MSARFARLFGIALPAALILISACTASGNPAAGRSCGPGADFCNVLQGYTGNTIDNGTSAATIGGGGVSGSPNQVSGDFGIVGGGEGNLAGEGAHLFLRAWRADLGLSLRAGYTFSLLIAALVIVSGRLVEVVFYEGPDYRTHLTLIPAVWLGGMSTQGLLLGGFLAMALFARMQRRSFLGISDALVIPAALIMAFARLANFVDGQIVGSITAVPWAVKFPGRGRLPASRGAVRRP